MVSIGFISHFSTFRNKLSSYYPRLSKASKLSYKNTQYTLYIISWVKSLCLHIEQHNYLSIVSPILLSNTDFVAQLLVKTITAALLFMLMNYHESSFPCHDMKTHHYVPSQHAEFA